VTPSSIALEDTLVGRAESVAGGINFDVEFPLYRENARHDGSTNADMQPNEALIFCGNHPRGGPTHRRVAHTAFDRSNLSRRRAATEQSVEVRTMVVFDPVAPLADRALCPPSRDATPRRRAAVTLAHARRNFALRGSAMPSTLRAPIFVLRDRQD